MKKKVTLALSAIIIFTNLLFPMIGQAEATDPVLEKIQKSGKLVIGLSADYPPYEFHATVNGKDQVVGADISMGEKIAEDLGVKLVVEELGFDALLGALNTGKIDLIISGMSPTPDRQKEVNFSDSYITINQRVVVRKADKDKYTDAKAFDGLKVAAQKQSTQEELAQTELTGSEVVSLPKVTDIVLNLQNKKVDGAVIEGPVAEAYVAQNPALALTDIDFENGQADMAIAMSKEAPALQTKVNETVKDIQDNNLMEVYKEEAGKLMFNEESFLKKYGFNYIKGAGYTILLAFVGVFAGAVLGTVLALMKLSKTKVFKWLSIIYIEYVRGTPLLVQIFLVYFGSAALNLNINALTAGCLALALNSGAYVAEIIRAGINAVNKGQLEAARSLGMNQGEAMKFIILPQAIKNILPALANEFVTVIKESSVVSVIGVSELMFQAGVVQGASFKPFLPIVLVSVVYFILTFTLSRIIGVAERRMSTSD
ncbi:ABC transporter substrate-binding protein/permease [Vagococcus salmoninarum]|uniref:ABC transporter substrate-binding protein/permease n=1 Tax=Vagococcus salmoninarum TaxID=2739 RepID=UPI001881040E|nr:ABC transporter substrate-binding protein/permease [Vagococcus salmoninarum]MBE9388677.1 ABC transporter substrate-binding protein/permease [Vagococcus salmoninarum]